MGDRTPNGGLIPRTLVDPFVPVAVGEASRNRARRLFFDRVIPHASFPDVPFDDGDCWAATVPRTHGRYLHGLLFLADWHRTILAKDSVPVVAVDGRDPVTFAADLALVWERMVTAATAPSAMAFHDETTAQRLMQIVRLLDDHEDDLDDARRRALSALAGRTASLLLEDHFYAGANNHGMFQDLALLRYAARPEVGPGPDQHTAAHTALARLDQYFALAFTEDGVHVENSPGYHFMVARFLRDVVPVMSLVEPQRGTRFAALYETAERYGTHCLLPDGSIAPLGDTKAVVVGATTHRSTFTGPEFRYAVTRGAKGRRPKERTVVFRHGGYAIHRTAWGDANAYVVCFKAAYASQYHHHCDDLALTIHGRGRWLLSEAGPYGYDYHDPMTRYGFSQFAHNTVVIDDRSLPRVDASPGGVNLKDLRSEGTDELLHVLGINERFTAARHQREVRVLERGKAIEVTVADTVTHDDGEEHDHDVLWHVGPGVHTFLRSHGAELYAEGNKVLELTWSAEAPVRAGMVRPRAGKGARALRFPQFGKHEEGSVIRVSARGRSLNLRTTIRSGEWFYPDSRIAAPYSGWTTTTGDVPVNYFLDTQPTAKHLAVTFSAMEVDRRCTHDDHSLLDGVPVHRLFILDDFGAGGAFCYSDHKSTHIRDEIGRLILQVMEKLSVSAARVAFLGKSAGGSAAIIHGSRLGVGKILVCAPRMLIGDHVSKHRPDVGQFMAGGSSPEDHAWLNEIVPRELAHLPPTTRLDLLLEGRDDQIEKELTALADCLEENRHRDWEVHVQEGPTHADLDEAFWTFAEDRLRKWVDGHLPEGVAVELVVGQGQVVVECPGIGPGPSVAVHLYRDQTRVEKVHYQREGRRFTFTGMEPGMYRARVFERKAGEQPHIHVTGRKRLPKG